MNIQKFNVRYEVVEGVVKVYIENTYYESYADLREAQDCTEDMLNESLAFDHKYKCAFCQEYFDEKDVQHRIEDHRFTAPWGSTFTIGGDVESIAVCPICGDDIEVN